MSGLWDLRFATNDFYDIPHNGDERDAYRDCYLLESTSESLGLLPNDDEDEKRLLRKPSLGGESLICNTFADISLICL